MNIPNCFYSPQATYHRKSRIPSQRFVLFRSSGGIEQIGNVAFRPEANGSCNSDPLACRNSANTFHSAMDMNWVHSWVGLGSVTLWWVGSNDCAFIFSKTAFYRLPRLPSTLNWWNKFNRNYYILKYLLFCHDKNLKTLKVCNNLRLKIVKNIKSHIVYITYWVGWRKIGSSHGMGHFFFTLSLNLHLLTVSRIQSARAPW